MTGSERTIDEQITILMRGTRFADEAEDWKDSTAKQSLRKQMETELRNCLKKKKVLRVYLGVDPTSSNLHIGHFVPLQKLRKFQELGHHVTFLIGDYTAMIGDPSGRSTGREKLTYDHVREMAKSFTEQAFRILDPDITDIRYNSEWLGKLTFSDIIELASIFPLKQIVARRDFQQRMDEGESLRFHEALYSLMQGYDAYALDCDIQVGAYDQHFNMLAGRVIQSHFGKTPHVMITNPLLIGTDGRKMSKSYGNTINIHDTPSDMYGKTMRIADEFLKDYLELSTSYSQSTIDELLQRIKGGENPMEVKKELAHHLVSLYYDTEKAKEAAAEFTQVVQKKAAPDDVPEVPFPISLSGKTWIEVMDSLKLRNSKNEAKRLIKQGGFYVNQKQMGDISQTAEIPEDGVLIRLGKRNYYFLKPE